MREIAIIGAGELGGAIAHALARFDLADVVRLIDDDRRVAEGKALDLTQAAPVEGFVTRLSGSTDMTTAGGAGVIVVADQNRGGEWQGDAGLRLVARLREVAPSAIVLCAGASQRDVVERAVRELHFDRRRILGTAPDALAAGVRGLVALGLDASPRDIALTVLGNPPDHIVVPWDAAALGGFALAGLATEPMRRRWSAQIPALWPPGPYALAAVVAKAVDAICGRARPVLSCFVAPDDSAGHRARAAALPVRLGPRGIETMLVPSLSVIDQVALDNATRL
jgi:malate dehydrogenase